MSSSGSVHGQQSIGENLFRTGIDTNSSKTERTLTYADGGPGMTADKNVKYTVSVTKEGLPNGDSRYTFKGKCEIKETGEVLKFKTDVIAKEDKVAQKSFEKSMVNIHKTLAQSSKIDNSGLKITDDSKTIVLKQQSRSELASTLSKFANKLFQKLTNPKQILQNLPRQVFDSSKQSSSSELKYTEQDLAAVVKSDAETVKEKSNEELKNVTGIGIHRDTNPQITKWANENKELYKDLPYLVKNERVQVLNSSKLEEIQQKVEEGKSNDISKSEWKQAAREIKDPTEKDIAAIKEFIELVANSEEKIPRPYIDLAYNIIDKITYGDAKDRLHVSFSKNPDDLQWASDVSANILDKYYS